MKKTASRKKPRRLLPNDSIRLVAPASPFDVKLLNSGMAVIRKLGYEPVVERCEFQRGGYLAGEDRDRARRLTAALQEESTAAVWCIRGGYGVGRLLRWLDLRALRAHPKLLIGFSDITALLLSLSCPGGFVTIHGPVVTQLSTQTRSSLSWLRRLLTDPGLREPMPLGKMRTVRGGRAEGPLLGGNMAVLTSLVGTSHFPRLAGSVLFLEDTGEASYELDRLFQQLWASGGLTGVSGLVIGSLQGCRPSGCRPIAPRTALEGLARQLNVPCLSGAAAGHQNRNMALPMGARVGLDADRGTLTLLEPAVAQSK